MTMGIMAMTTPTIMGTSTGMIMTTIMITTMK